MQPQLLPLIQQLLQGQQRLEARMDNMHIRSLNRRSIADSAALQPLRREVQQAAAGGAVPGDLPPAGVFPADTQALFDVGSGRPCWAERAKCVGRRLPRQPCALVCHLQLTHAQLDALEDFYGRPFAGGSGGCLGCFCARAGSGSVPLASLHQHSQCSPCPTSSVHACTAVVARRTAAIAFVSA